MSSAPKKLGIEKLNYFPQRADHDCGVGLAGIVATSTNTPFDYDLAYKELGTTEEWGTEPYAIMSFFKKRGFDVSLTLHTPTSDILVNMAKGSICGVLYQNCGYSRQVINVDSGHYGAVGSILNGIVRIVDPDSWTGQYNLSVEEFAYRSVDVDKRGNIISGGVLVFTPPYLLKRGEPVYL